jgi:hypothetical protein
MLNATTYTTISMRRPLSLAYIGIKSRNSAQNVPDEKSMGDVGS